MNTTIDRLSMAERYFMRLAVLSFMMPGEEKLLLANKYARYANAISYAIKDLTHGRVSSFTSIALLSEVTLHLAFHGNELNPDDLQCKMEVFRINECICSINTAIDELRP